jgi:hypothetical protein
MKALPTQDCLNFHDKWDDTEYLKSHASGGNAYEPITMYYGYRYGYRYD